MGRFGNSDDPWFRVGTVDINTTLFIVGLGVLSMFVWAIEGPPWSISRLLVLGSRAPDEMIFDVVLQAGGVLDGQVWRLITWPFPNQPDFWTVILFAIFFMLGSQLEAQMGRRLFTAYILAMVILPALIVTLYELLTGRGGGVAGLRFLEVGVLIGFALRNPKAMFWPGIPAWVIAGGVVLLDFLQLLGYRQSHTIVMLFATVGVSMLAIRALGFAEEAEWIPKIPVPASFGGAPKQRTARSTSKRKRRGGAKLSVAPAPTAAPRRELSRLEEAEIDAILDQVSERGMDSLSSQQRKSLEDHSKRLRKRDQ